MIPQLQTPRLYLRPLELADAQQTQLLFPHWKIVRYLANVVPRGPIHRTMLSPTIATLRFRRWTAEMHSIGP
jgi:hypothetical protein